MPDTFWVPVNFALLAAMFILLETIHAWVGPGYAAGATGLLSYWVLFHWVPFMARIDCRNR